MNPTEPPSQSGPSDAEGLSHELDRLVVDAAPDAMIVTAPDGTIVLGNLRARQMFGYEDSPNALVGLTVDALLPESLRASHARHRGGYRRHPKAREMGSGLELLGRRADGTEIPVEVSLSPVRVDGEHFVVAAIRDLTEHRAAEASMRATRDRLALVAERERIGRDLHDSVIQRLYGAGLGMQAALGADEERLRAVVSSAVDEIDDTIAEIRTVIHDLRRDLIDTGALEDRLQTVVDAQAAALGVPVRLEVLTRRPVDPPTPLADAVLAVVRECIANAHRHGGASRIDVQLDQGVDRWLGVTVRDDGAGFDPAKVSGGYGLTNLRARAAEFEGTFVVESTRGSGTRTIWRVPIPPADVDRTDPA